MNKFVIVAGALMAGVILLAGCIGMNDKKPVSSAADAVSANKAAGEAFMAKIASEEGVGRTASGLCYRVIEEGKGEVPTHDDKVIVH